MVSLPSASTVRITDWVEEPYEPAVTEVDWSSLAPTEFAGREMFETIRLATVVVARFVTPETESCVEETFWRFEDPLTWSVPPTVVLPASVEAPVTSRVDEARMAPEAMSEARVV